MNSTGENAVRRQTEETAARVTLRQVAARAGVHLSTASRVLSGARTVRPEIARKVRAAAQQLNYQVDPIARALALQQTQTVGMVVPNIDNPFFPAVIRSVEQQLDERDKALVLCDARDDPVVEAKRVQSLIAGRVDALLISPVHSIRSAEAVRAAAQRLPVVQLDRRVEVATDTVRVDQAQGIRLAVAHLRDGGSRRLALVTAQTAISTLEERTEEWLRCFADDPDSRTRILTGDLSIAGGEHMADLILNGADPLPDGIICGNDELAVGVIRALKRAGISIPHDVAVLGFDDTPLGTVLDPTLTSVRQPLAQLGAEAVDLLERNPSHAPRQMVLTPELVVRESTRLRTDFQFPSPR